MAGSDELDDTKPARKDATVIYRRPAEILSQFQSWNIFSALPTFYSVAFRNVSIWALLQYTHVHPGWDLRDLITGT